MKNGMARLCALLLTAMLLVTSSVYAQTPQETLSQYIVDLRKSSNDNALREKIIKHVQTMKPAPAVPEEAREHFVMATAIRGGAKNIKGYELAIKEYEATLLVAPWWPEALKELAIVQKLANQYDGAIQSLSLYILTGPADARDAKDEIYKIKAAKKLAAAESRQTAADIQPAIKPDDWLKRIDGRRYRDTRGGPAILEVRGKDLVLIGPDSGGRMGVLNGPWEIRGRMAATPWQNNPLPFPVQTKFTISEDGDRITERRDFSDGDVREFIWLWQR